MTKKVLIVEDNHKTRQILEEMLKENNLITFTAEDGLQGLRIAKKVRPDIIACDLNLPRMGGIDFITNLRINGDDTPVILYSSKASDEDTKFLAFRAKVLAFITDPDSDIKKTLEQVTIRLTKAFNDNKNLKPKLG